MKDEFKSLNTQRQPGPLAEALGGRVEQYYALDAPVSLAARNSTGTATIWAEHLSTSASDTQVNLRYADSGGWLDGKPAMITHSVGKGSIAYLGTLPNEAFLSTILSSAMRDAHAEVPRSALPVGVELCMRAVGSGELSHRVTILINHNETTKEITLGGHFKSLLPGIVLTATHAAADTPATQISLPPQGVAVLISEPVK
jgi:beta-galactosidase